VNEHSGWIAGQQVPQSIGRGWWLQVKDRSMLLAGLASGRFLGSTDLPEARHSKDADWHSFLVFTVGKLNLVSVSCSCPCT
jgi:hypothetical protein